jgi:hypothetical protein
MMRSQSSLPFGSQYCGNNLDQVKRLLEYLDPDLSYDAWLRVLMAIFYESHGSEEGFEIANEWSSRGWSYKGEREIRAKWRSFKLEITHPITIATIRRMVGTRNK